MQKFSLPFTGSPSHSLKMSFDAKKKKNLNFNLAQLISLLCLCLISCLINFLLSPVKPSKSFIVLHFTSISLIPLELIFDAPYFRHVKCEKQYVSKN